MFVVEENLPHYWRWTQLPQDKVKRQSLKKKIEKVVNRRYIEKGAVTNLTGFFDVPKGEDGVQIVYHARECGLNDALWAPNFGLPTVKSLAQMMDTHS
eukprot:6608134-Ditylum_brightwellii.AAC.1